MSNLSFVRHAGDGTTTQFALAVAGENIGYFRTSDIKTYVDDIEVANIINVASPHLVIIEPAPADASDVLIRREVPIDQPYANFERGNNFGHRQVNNSFLQQLYLTQEMLDGFTPEGFYFKQDINMGGHRVTNVGTPIELTDAATLQEITNFNDRVTAVEGSITSESRYVRWLYNNGVAAGGEIEINIPFTFTSVNSVFVNGIRQTHVLAYDYDAGAGTVEFVEPLEAGDEVVISLGQEALETLPVFNDLINDLSQAYEFPTVAAYKAFATTFPDGKQIKLLDRDAIFTKISGIGTANSRNIIASLTASQSITLNIGKVIIMSQWIDAPSDAETAFPIIDALSKNVIIDVPINTGALASTGSFVEFVTGSSMTGSVTFTFNGNVSGNSVREHIFIGNNDIVVGGVARQLYPEWFGILTESMGNDGNIDLYSHVRRAGRSVGDSQCDILFGDGKYFIRDFLLDASNCGMKGAGKDRTTLENSTINNASTRLGVFVSIFAPHSNYSVSLGNRDWDGITNKVITDCHISDMTLIWDDTKTVASDPLMNCLAVLGCQGGTVKGVHAVLFTGQRAFAVQTHDVDQKTEDILFTECSSVGSLVGIYISEGFADNNSGKSFKNIQVINNHFSVRHNPSSAQGDTSTPIFFHGGERPENIDAGIVIVRGNHCEGGARGAGSGSAGEFTRFNSKVILDTNHFVNFREHGTILYMEDIELINNVYDSPLMQTDVIQAAGIVLKTQLAHAAAITGATQTNPVVITSTAHQFTNGQKVQFDSVAGMVELNGRTFTVSNSAANTYELLATDGTGFTAYTSGGTASHFGGTRRAIVRGNKYKRLSGIGTIYGTQIDALAGMSVLLDANHHIYSDLKPPVYDLFASDSLGITCDIKASNNVYYDTGAANVRVTTVNQEMLLWDLGGNDGMNLFNGEIYGVRFSAPSDRRYYKRGTQLSFGIPLFTAGTQVGYMATADHTPTSPAIWKNIIG